MVRFDVISQLEAEWEKTLDCPVAGARFCALQVAEPVLADLEDLRHLVAVMAARSTAQDFDRHDEVLLALLRHSRERTVLGAFAARIAVELLLPGVKGRCGGAHLARLEPAERPGALLAALYEEIRAPQSPWKPVRVGAQVLGRAYQRLRPRRGVAARVRTVLRDDLDMFRPAQAERVHPSVEVLDLLAEAVREGRLSQEKAYLIAAVRVAGVSVGAIAQELGVSYAAAVQRLHRAEVEFCRSVPKAA